MKNAVSQKYFLPKFGAFLLITLCCQLALGATVNQEKERLAALQQNLVSQEESLIVIKAELQTLPAAITTRQESTTKAEAELNIEQVQFDKVKQEHSTAPTAGTERQLRLAEIKAGLAATRVRSETRELGKLRSQQKQLEESLASTEAAIQSGRSQITRQERAVAEAIESARQQAIADARAKEQARIAAAMPIIVPPKQEAKVTAPEPATDAAPTPSPSTETVNDTITLSESDFEEFQFAKEKMATATDLAAEATANDQANFSELKLGSSEIEDTSFIYLGNQQYRAEVALTSGRHSFRIEDLRFRVDVPESETAQDYIFLVDAGNKDQMRASYFKKILLSYLDKTVVVAPEPAAPKETVAVNGVLMSKSDFEELQFAQEKMAAAESLAATATDGEQPNFSELRLSNSNIDNVTFSHLGNQQYRADVALTTGRYTFRVEGLRFNVNVPESEIAQDYVFLVDARDKKRLRISYFRKALLSADKAMAAQ